MKARSNPVTSPSRTGVAERDHIVHVITQFLPQHLGLGKSIRTHPVLVPREYEMDVPSLLLWADSAVLISQSTSMCVPLSFTLQMDNVRLPQGQSQETRDGDMSSCCASQTSPSVCPGKHEGCPTILSLTTPPCCVPMLSSSRQDSLTVQQAVNTTHREAGPNHYGR